MMPGPGFPGRPRPGQPKPDPGVTLYNEVKGAMPQGYWLERKWVPKPEEAYHLSEVKGANVWRIWKEGAQIPLWEEREKAVILGKWHAHAKDCRPKPDNHVRNVLIFLIKDWERNSGQLR